MPAADCHGHGLDLNIDSTKMPLALALARPALGHGTPAGSVNDSAPPLSGCTHVPRVRNIETKRRRHADGYTKCWKTSSLYSVPPKICYTMAAAKDSAAVRTAVQGRLSFKR